MATVYSLVCWGGRTGKVVSISASTDVVTLTNHGLRNGTKLWPSGTLPSELNTSTPVYARSTGANTFTLHTSAAGAIANTGQITFSGSSTYAAVTLKSDLVADPANSLAAYGLSDLSRWGSSGSERIYDGIYSWYATRTSLATQFDSEVCEIGEAFTEDRTGGYFYSSCGAALDVVIESRINGIRSAAFHGGVYGNGYQAACYFFYTGVGITIDGITIKAGNPLQSNGLLSLISATRVKVKNNIIYGGNTAYCFGITMQSDNSCFVENNVIIAVKEGIVNYGAAHSVIANNLCVKCGTGFVNYGNSAGSPRYGYWYNNISIGNTTNWGVEPTSLQGATNNYGLATDTPWAVGAGTVGVIATTDFVDYANNDFRPASVTSPQVDTGTNYFGMASYDIAENERPNYNNGGAEYIDVGPYEFDHGYGPHPATHTLTLTNVVVDSRVLIESQDGATQHYNAVAAASTVVIPITVYGDSRDQWRIKIRKASSSPFYQPWSTLMTATAGASSIYVSQIPDD